MEEEWDIIDSSLKSSPEAETSSEHRPSLDFNRFHSMPHFNIEDDEEEEDEEQEEASFFLEQKPVDQVFEEKVVLKEQEFEFTLGDSKLMMMNDTTTTSDGDDSNDQDNRLMHDNQNDESINKSIPFLSSLNKTNLLITSTTSTRESQVDKNTVWKNSTSGSSVPYMSNQSQQSSGGEEQGEDSRKNITQHLFPFPSFQNQFEYVGPASESTTNDSERHTSSRPIKQARGPIQRSTKPTLTTHELPSFAASPKERPTLTTQRRHIVVDFPPQQPPPQPPQQNNEPVEQSAQEINDKVTSCMSFVDDGHDHLATFMFELQALTPVQQWSQLRRLNLSKQKLTSLNDMSSCFPMLETLSVSHNELTTLSELPASLIYLYASHNKLLQVDMHHLERLQYLDVSHNRIDEFKSFQDLPALVTLSLKANCIRRLVDFKNAVRSNKLESLDVSYNRIECLDSIESLTQLRELNADYNDLKHIQLNQPIARLCKLQLSFNRLKSFDASLFPDIRVLYLDDNLIQRMIGFNGSRLDAFSLRDQGGHNIDFNLQHLRGTRKFYLSGSPCQSLNRMIDFYSLEYLEICSAELEELPPDFGKQVPNLSTLYLSMNRLVDIQPLRKLKYLKRLVLIDNRLISVNEVIRVVQSLKQLHYLDLRQNPMSSNIYPSIDFTLVQRTKDHDKISPYVSTALDESWAMYDAEFVESLSERWTTRRQVYRALFMQYCPALIELDHIRIDSNDRSEVDLVIGNFKKSQASSSYHGSQYS